VVVAGLLAWALAGCDDGTSPRPATQFELPGTYSGPIVAATDGASLDADLTLEIHDNDGGIAGTFSLRGRLVYQGAMAEIAGDGTFTGAVGPEPEPILDMLFRTPLCDSWEGVFVGRFIPSDGRIFLGGPIDIFSGGCAVLVRFDAGFTLYQETSPNV
jgi:hypothetical protein